MANKDSSLLEIAIELLHKKKKPQNINDIIKEVMSIKGLRSVQAKEAAPQFVLDFMASGFFVYCGEDTWDLKERQPTSVLDKEVADYPDFDEDDEFKEQDILDDLTTDFDLTDTEELEDDDEDEEEQEVDDLEEEFEELIGDEDELVEDEYDVDEDEEEDDTVSYSGLRKKTKGKIALTDDDDVIDEELLDDLDDYEDDDEEE